MQVAPLLPVVGITSTVDRPSASVATSVDLLPSWNVASTPPVMQYFTIQSETGALVVCPSHASCQHRVLADRYACRFRKRPLRVDPINRRRFFSRIPRVHVRCIGRNVTDAFPRRCNRHPRVTARHYHVVSNLRRAARQNDIDRSVSAQA